MYGVGMDIGGAPLFDGTNFPCSKTLMTYHLQVKGLDIWRVTEEEMRSRLTNKEIQCDAMAKSVLLSSLCTDVFNHVYSHQYT